MTELFSIRSDMFPLDTRVLAFTGTEGISRTYSFELYLLVPAAESEVFDMGAAVNARATLTLHQDDGAPRTWYHGVISSIELAHELPGDALYRAVLEPRLWQLKLGLHSTVFVNQSIAQIIEGVLQDNGLAAEDYDLRLARRPQPLEHVCQYRESDFDFISRWMEREGMYFFFEQGADRERLIITDTRSFHEPFSGSPVRFFAASGGDSSAREAMRTFTCRHAALPASVLLKDYDYLRPTLDVSGAAAVAANGTGEVYSFGDNLASPNDGRRLAAVRAQELLARQVVYQGSGRVYDLRPGYTFELDEHPRAAFNAEYLAVEVEHQGNQMASSPEARALLPFDAEESYRVRVAAIPASVQYRPERLTPWPRIYGVETAVVDGEAESDYAQIDDHGRYKLKVLFDEADTRNGQASTWVRMLQPHGGSQEGFHFPLRKGTEVMLVFLGGDPDRPAIVGVGPNAMRPSPVTHANHTHNVIQTGGLNRIEIEDTAGAQYIKLTTPTEETMLHLGAPHNPTHNIQAQTRGNTRFDFGTDWDIKVGHEKTEEVGRAVKETYKATQTTEVTGLVKETYKASQETHVTGTRQDTVTGQVTEQYGAQATTVSGAVTETYNSGQATTIARGGQTNTITGPQQTTLTGNRVETINGSLTQTITQGGTINSPAGYTINATAGLTVVATAGATIVAPGGHNETHSSWFKMSGASGEFVPGIKMAIVSGMKLDLINVNVGLSTIKVDLVGLKMADQAQEIKNVGTSIKNAGIAIKNGAINYGKYVLFIVS